MTESFPGERRLLAEACQVLAARDLAPGFLGHVSLRVADDLVLVRCRGPRERGLAWTVPDDIRLVRMDGAEGAPGELGRWSVPNELPLHLAVLGGTPGARAVVHAHPPAVVAADLAGLTIRPIVGAYDIPGAKLAAGGVPVFRSGALISTADRAAAMLAAMAGRPVAVLRGHGLTSAGGSVQEAVLRAVSVDAIARLALTVTASGGRLVDLPADEIEALPDLGPAFTEGVAWRHELARTGDRRFGHPTGE